MDLFPDSNTALATSYSHIYESLTGLRESFHRSGRLDDSNAKLDEVSKLFATCLAYRNGQIGSFPGVGDSDLVARLQAAFQQAVALPQYQLKDGGSIFGSNPNLVLRGGDEALAADLVALVTQCVDLAFEMRSEERPFDILNEAFGHFVRDNFRGNVEDAQYMTPPEVVDFVVDMALSDIRDEDAANGDVARTWTVLDPSCGVGSFLATFYHHARGSGWLEPGRLRLLGQDKVERMVRLSTINLELFDVAEHHIYVGNSLEKGSQLDAWNGKVDLILTNPPFGARFDQQYIVEKCGENTPFFASLKRTASSIDSELLFIDRNMSLLREGGRLLIVVPDGVVSAKGIAALLRAHLAREATLISVIELPATTFAQAGTRTRTAIVYLQKGRKPGPAQVFMGAAKDLGFQVASRKGVQIKIPDGRNELPAILDAFNDRKEAQELSTPVVLMREPSCVLVTETDVIKGSWTPNHYSAVRFDTVAQVRGNPDFDLVPLRDLVSFCADERKAETWREGVAFISVLHILGEGFIDVAGALGHAPKTPGVRTEPEEILVSRINPRIPRVCVTPELGMRVLCSSEFEVMRCVPGLDAYALAYLLQTDIVQNQIRSLTSGTSASHNRIRTAELSQVLVPMAKEGTGRATTLRQLTDTYRNASRALAENATLLARMRSQDAALFSP